MKIIGQSESFISKEGKSIKHQFILQSEGKRWYFVSTDEIRSSMCVPIGNLGPKSLKMSYFRNKSGNRETSGNSLNFQIFANKIDF